MEREENEQGNQKMNIQVLNTTLIVRRKPGA